MFARTLTIALGALVFGGSLPVPTARAAEPSATTSEFTLTFERPKPAITGSEYTMKVVYPEGYTVPSNAKCSWQLRWGDDASLYGLKSQNETFGQVRFDVPRSGCFEWTFTLPYTSALQYHLTMDYCIPNSTGGATCPFATWYEDRQWEFQAELGTTDRHIRHSNLQVAYVLPNRYDAVVGEPVTYTLYGSDGWLPPTSGTHWHATCPCRTGPDWPTQWGGRTFTFIPDTIGHWTVSWNVLNTVESNFARSAQFDPPARAPDTSRPNTTVPVASLGGGVPTTTTVPTTISWTGSDTGWGIARYDLHRSVDGGPWQSLRLSAALARSYVDNLARGHTYRYAVRAVDKAGNVGYWDYGATFWPGYVTDGDTRVTYGKTWGVETDANALGGSLRATSLVGATATYTFTGRDVGWMAERGPTRGRAKVYIDGVYALTIDLTASSEQPKRLVLRKHWSTKGTHTIRIVTEGTAGRPSVTLDGFISLH